MPNDVVIYVNLSLRQIHTAHADATLYSTVLSRGQCKVSIRFPLTGRQQMGWLALATVLCVHVV